MLDHYQRYTVADLLPPAAHIRVMRHRMFDVAVHWHDFYELALVAEGVGRHVVNGVPGTIEPGSAFLVTPADFHELRATSSEPLRYFNVVIDPSLIEGQLGDLLFTADRTAWRVGDFSAAEPDFHRLWKESQEKQYGSAILMDSVLRCILVEFSRCCTSTLSVRDRQWRPDGSDIRPAVLYIDYHFRERLTLAGVAAQVHLSPNYFSERFREFTGTSFQSYLQQRRLLFARSLLTATDLGVTEVCHAAGFNSLSHFGRAFRRQFGSSPSSVRRLSADRQDVAVGDVEPGTPGTAEVVPIGSRGSSPAAGGHPRQQAR